ncbi:restriction endonuclease subunit S [Alcaligenes faecalis]|uniref:restriction endonuclease subunit S n=1 Tax=Alcaligenes faecalis TaxID=511 RepID=UPI0018D028C6|nr:restriction endonuclease subunit S [Alcaligenes faecalis]MBH0311773.1 restriction endonuclease subunit S [Alcaligenes faecalis]
MSENSALTTKNFEVLGPSISIIKGKKPSVIYQNPVNDESHPYILIENFGRSYRQYTDDSSCKLAYKDDVLIVWDGERAGLASHGHSGYIGSTLAAIRIADRSLVSKYLLYIIEKERAQLRGSSEGTGVPHLSRWAVENINYFKPQKPEQKKIATILSSVDDVIEKTRAQIDKLKDLKTGMMQELLTQGIGHTEFKDSQVGKIPKTWKLCKLESVCDLQVGYAFKSSWFLERGIRLLRGENVGFGYPIWGQTRYLSEAQSIDFANYHLVEGDVIIGMDRTFTKSGTKISRLRCNDVPALLVQRVGKYIPKSIDIDFLWQLLRSPRYLEALQNQEKGMDIPHLSKTEILDVLVLVPPLLEQQKIATMLSKLDELIEASNQKLDRSLGLKKALMQDLLTGKVRVKATPTETAAA